MERLYKKLESYGQSDYYPFHMPGHKRNKASSAGEFPFERDITEISGFDNLHHAEGILKEAQEYAAKIYGTKKCFFSVNGSTAALLAAVSASVNKGGKILVARNCHKAVYHALYLRELQPVYIYPHEDQRLGINGGISPERVERYLEENTDVQAFLLTSPTYEAKPEEWDAMIDTNVKGLLTMTRLVVPGMVERNEGNVINIGSVAGDAAYAGGNVYCATKAAVKALSDGLRIDVADTAVRVTNLKPGLVETNFSKVRFHGDNERADNVYKGIKPLTGADIADVAFYAASAPKHVQIAEVLILATHQASGSVVHREK